MNNAGKNVYHFSHGYGVFNHDWYFPRRKKRAIEQKLKRKNTKTSAIYYFFFVKIHCGRLVKLSTIKILLSKKAKQFFPRALEWYERKYEFYIASKSHVGIKKRWKRFILIILSPLMICRATNRSLELYRLNVRFEPRFYTRSFFFLFVHFFSNRKKSTWSAYAKRTGLVGYPKVCCVQNTGPSFFSPFLLPKDRCRR